MISINTNERFFFEYHAILIRPQIYWQFYQQDFGYV